MMKEITNERGFCFFFKKKKYAMKFEMKAQDLSKLRKKSKG